MNPMNSAWVVLKDDLSGGDFPPAVSLTGEPKGPCDCPEAQMLHKLYVAGLIMGAGWRGGEEGGMNHPEADALIEEMEQMMETKRQSFSDRDFTMDDLTRFAANPFDPRVHPDLRPASDPFTPGENPKRSDYP